MVKSELRVKSFQAAFGLAVRARRAQLGITQEELGFRAELHRTYVAGIERGARNPSLESIRRLAQALEVSLGNLFEALRDHGPATSAALPGAATGAASAASAASILLVEDDLLDVELTLEAFKEAGLTNRVHVARDGAAALDYLFGASDADGLTVNPPRLILLDLGLPKVTGLEVLRRLKSDPRTRSLPVVVLTGSERSSDFQESKRLGAEAYIIKPVDFTKFTAVTPRLRLGWTLLELAPAAGPQA